MSSATESHALERVASEYEERGYRVILQPSPAQLPDFLSSFRPDLLAQSADENVVVEVKSKAELRDHTLAELSREVAKHPGWRFELLLANPRSGQEVPTDAPVAEPQAAAARVEEAERLLDSDFTEAAALIAWSAAESALRQLASRENLDSIRGGSSYLLKHLFSNGLLARSTYDRLTEAMELRNAVSHGFESPRPAPDQVRSLIAETRDLLRSLSEAA